MLLPLRVHTFRALLREKIMPRSSVVGYVEYFQKTAKEVLEVSSAAPKDGTLFTQARKNFLRAISKLVEHVGGADRKGLATMYCCCVCPFAASLLQQQDSLVVLNTGSLLGWLLR